MDRSSWRAIAIIKAKPGKEKELEDYTLEVIPQIRKVDGLHKLEVSRSIAEPGRYVLYYWWQSLAYSNRYVDGPTYASIMPKLKELLQEHTLILAKRIDG